MNLSHPEDRTDQACKVKAGFFRRLEAFIYDLIILSFVLLVTIVYILPFIIDYFEPLTASGNLAVFVSIFLLLVEAWLYFAVFESSDLRATPGKLLKKIIVIGKDEDSISFARATIRFGGKILSAMILFIGFLMAGFTKNRLALHDLISNTRVLNHPSLNPGKMQLPVKIPLEVVKWAFIAVILHFTFTLLFVNSTSFFVELLEVRPFIYSAVERGVQKGIFEKNYRLDEELSDFLKLPDKKETYDITDIFKSYLITDGTEFTEEKIKEKWSELSCFWRFNIDKYKGDFKEFQKCFSKINWKILDDLNRGTSLDYYYDEIVSKISPEKLSYLTAPLPNYMVFILISKAIAMRARELHSRGNQEQALKFIKKGVHLGRILTTGLNTVEYYVGRTVLRISIRTWLKISNKNDPLYSKLEEFLKRLRPKYKEYYITNIYSPYMQVRMPRLYRKYKNLLDPNKIPDAFWTEALFTTQLIVRTGLEDNPVYDIENCLNSFLPKRRSARLQKMIDILDFSPVIERDCAKEARKLGKSVFKHCEHMVGDNTNVPDPGLNFYEKILMLPMTKYFIEKPIWLAISGIMSAVAIPPLEKEKRKGDL